MGIDSISVSVSKLFSTTTSLLFSTDEDRYSWLENYAGSSGLQLKTQASVMLENGVPIDQLELDRWQSPLGFCPLLADPANYLPDTVDLNGDHEAR